MRGCVGGGLPSAGAVSAAECPESPWEHGTPGSQNPVQHQSLWCRHSALPCGCASLRPTSSGTHHLQTDAPLKLSPMRALLTPCSSPRPVPGTVQPRHTSPHTCSSPAARTVACQAISLPSLPSRAADTPANGHTQAGNGHVPSPAPGQPAQVVAIFKWPAALASSSVSIVGGQLPRCHQEACSKLLLRISGPNLCVVQAASQTGVLGCLHNTQVWT